MRLGARLLYFSMLKMKKIVNYMEELKQMLLILLKKHVIDLKEEKINTQTS